MNAGRIDIEIAANYAKLEAQLRQVERSSIDAGRKAGSGFAEFFSKASANLGQQVSGQVMKTFGFAAISQGMAAALKAGVEDKSWNDALIDVIKSIPIANIAVQILESGLDVALGLTKQKRQMQETIDESEKLRSATETRLQTKQANAERVAGYERVLRERQIQLEIERLKKSAQTEETQQAYLAAMEKLDQEKFLADKRKALAEAASDEEIELVNRVFSAREDDERRARFNSWREIYRDFAERERQEKRFQEEKQKAAIEAEREEMTAIGELAREQGENRIKIEERIAQKRAELAESQAAGISTGATALGSFKFDAYPDSEKKRNDEQQLAKLEEIRDAIYEGVRIDAETAGGFF